jgi:hypothetical protein
MPTESVATGVEHENQIFTSIIAMSLLGIASISRADSIPVGQIAKELKTESVLPFAGGVAIGLAKDMLQAQAAASYGGPVSLELSIESVLKAIGIEAQFGWLVVGGQSTDPIVWSQAMLAVDPNATVSLTPDAINFGEVAVATPEPEVWILMLLGLAGSMVWASLLPLQPVPLDLLGKAVYFDSTRSK